MEARELCEELDKTLLELMDSLKQLSTLRNKYREDVNEGYFTMSQARHAMGGPSQVSQLQYDSNMKSLVHISLMADPNEVDPLPTGQESCTEFKVQRLKPGEVRVELEEVSTEGLLRRRKGEESVEDVPMESSREVRGEELKDPMKWFGILVPQNLRRSQQYFIQAIHDCAELATAQTRLVTAHKKYEELLAKKRELVHEQ